MDNPKIQARLTGKYGHGVFAIKNIKKGEVVAEFDGPIYSTWYRKWNNDLYNHTIQIGPHKWKDSLGVARLLNHSCEPNCGIKNYTQVVAMRNIKAGEEITWDYEMTEDHPYWRMKCKCGAKTCRKIIGSYKNMPESVRQKYKGYISQWLLDIYN
jgi:uncharacterized protein